MNNPFLESLAQKLIGHILEAADKTQPDWSDVELSLARIIARKKQLEERVRELETAYKQVRDTLVDIHRMTHKAIEGKS